MITTIIRQATVSAEHFLTSCPRYASEKLLENPSAEIRAYVISVMGVDVVFQVYIDGHYMFERQGSDPRDERTGVATFDAFMARLPV